MRRWSLAVFGASALASAACPTRRADELECLAACDAAARCGVLPSTLGGAVDDDPIELTRACFDRCVASDADEARAVLDCLLPAFLNDLCAVDTCVEVVDCLRRSQPEAVVGAATATFRLIDGEFWQFLFDPQMCDLYPVSVSGISEDTQDLYCNVVPDPCATEDLNYDRPPLCFGTACDPRADGNESCDPRLCLYDVSASFDCAVWNIGSVQFGYVDERDVLHLDPNIYTCAEASAGVTLSGIKSGQVIYPLAYFRGRVSSRLRETVGLPASGEFPEYCWLSYPSMRALGTGWFVRADQNVLPVPSPSSAYLASKVEFSPELFPFGCDCPPGETSCESQERGNCDNAFDDDRDGLSDLDDPGCWIP